MLGQGHLEKIHKAPKNLQGFSKKITKKDDELKIINNTMQSMKQAGMEALEIKIKKVRDEICCTVQKEVGKKKKYNKLLNAETKKKQIKFMKSLIARVEKRKAWKKRCGEIEMHSGERNSDLKALGRRGFESNS